MKTKLHIRPIPSRLALDLTGLNVRVCSLRLARVCLASVVAFVTESPARSDGDSSVGRTSAARKEQEMAYLLEQMNPLNSDIKTIDAAISDFTRLMSLAEKITLPDSGKKAAATMKTRLNAIRQKTNQVNTNDSDVVAFLDAVTSYEDADAEDTAHWPKEVATYHDAVSKHFRGRYGVFGNVFGRASAQPPTLVQTILLDSRLTSLPEPEFPELPKTVTLRESLAPGDSDEARSRSEQGAPLTWESLAPAINDAAAELETLSEQLDQASEAYRNELKAALSDGERALIVARDARRKEQEDLKKRYDALDAELIKGEEGLRGVDKMLTYAVYFMVAAIIILFLALTRFTNPELAKLLVQERTMIEILSMGFLLLTIIILGTGQKIQGETLGALLGTIAGYIFGRKEGERRGAQEERDRIIRGVQKK